MSDTNNTPIARVTVFPVTANIWRNESTEGRAIYATTFERRYRDKDNKWKSAISFNSDELLIVSKVADLAHTEVLKLRASDRTSAPQAEIESEVP